MHEITCLDDLNNDNIKINNNIKVYDNFFYDIHSVNNIPYILMEI